MTDLASPSQLGQSAKGLGERHVWIRRMKLIQIDAFKPQASQAALQGTAQMLRVPVGRPAAIGAGESALGSDHKPGRIGVKRFGDESLRDLGTILSAVSKKLCPSWNARTSNLRIAAGSFGSPHTPEPVTRMAPKARRFTVKSPSRTVPARAAGCVVSLIQWLKETVSGTVFPGHRDGPENGS